MIEEHLAKPREVLWCKGRRLGGRTYLEGIREGVKKEVSRCHNKKEFKRIMTDPTMVTWTGRNIM